MERNNNKTLESIKFCIPSWKGDETCDDINNNEKCDWDGGDCCGDNIRCYPHDCQKCQCLDPDWVQVGWEYQYDCDPGCDDPPKAGLKNQNMKNYQK